MKIEMIKSYIEKHMPLYNHLVDGSVEVLWGDPTITGDEVWVWISWKDLTLKDDEVTHRSYYREPIAIDLIDLLAFVFEMNIDRKNEN